MATRRVNGSGGAGGEDAKDADEAQRAQRANSRNGLRRSVTQADRDDMKARKSPHLSV